MEFRLRLIRARPNYYMIRDKPNVSLRFVDCSPYTRRIVLDDDYHKKRLGMSAKTRMYYNSLETFAKTFIISARRNKFTQEIILNSAPVRRTAIAKNANSASTGLYTENPFCCQHVNLRQK